MWESCTSTTGFFPPGYLIFVDAILNYFGFFRVSYLFFSCWYLEIFFFCMLILYPITSLKTLVSSDNHRMNILHTQSGLLQFLFFQSFCFLLLFTSFSCSIALLGLQYLIEMVIVSIFIFLQPQKEKNWYFCR